MITRLNSNSTNPLNRNFSMFFQHQPRSEQELKEVVQILNRLSLLYWQPQGFQSQEYIRSLVGHWREAFKWFLSSYAFERQGRSPHYSIAAVKAVNKYEAALPYPDFEEKVWKDFLISGRFADDGRGANKKNNPLAPAGGAINSASLLVTSLEDYDFNIVKWASSLVKSGEIETVWNKLVQIRGIGSKIASLFLRDVVYAFEIDEDKIEKKVYLQPIDVWTERGARALAQYISETPKLYWEFAEVLVEVSERVNVRSTLTNVGLWTFGAQLVRNPARFHDLLLNVEELHSFLSKQIDWHRERAKLLEIVLEYPTGADGERLFAGHRLVN